MSKSLKKKSSKGKGTTNFKVGDVLVAVGGEDIMVVVKSVDYSGITPSIERVDLFCKNGTVWDTRWFQMGFRHATFEDYVHYISEEIRYRAEENMSEKFSSTMRSLNEEIANTMKNY